MLFLLIYMNVVTGSGQGAGSEGVKTGLDVLITERPYTLEHKNIAVIANHTSITRDGEWILDGLTRVAGVHIELLLIPEHGLDLLDQATRVRWQSTRTIDLHGEKRRPDEEMLSGIDALIFDIQDLGCRFYTYISTMLLAMDAAAITGVEFIVLDRPNPLGGVIVEGPVLDPDFRSFVGMLPIPARYGLTIGELARMVNGEHYLLSGKTSRLTVIEMKNWKRSMFFDETGLPWIPPSPNMPDMESALLYPGLCLLEGTNLSEGRGTPFPFQLVGAPWLRVPELVKLLEETDLTGICLSETTFMPVPIPGKTENPKYGGEAVQGLKMRVTERDVLRPFRFAALLIDAAAGLDPEKFEWTGKLYIDRLAGTDLFRKAVDRRDDIPALLSGWDNEAAAFKKKSTLYHLYGN